jgi:LPS sulfotransferase NodH
LTQNKTKLFKKLIITLVFEKKTPIFAKNDPKSQKILIITSTPGHPAAKTFIQDLFVCVYFLFIRNDGLLSCLEISEGDRTRSEDWVMSLDPDNKRSAPKYLKSRVARWYLYLRTKKSRFWVHYEGLGMEKIWYGLWSFGTC